MSEMGGGLNRLPERKAQDAVMDTGLSMLATFMSLRDLAGDAWQDKLDTVPRGSFASAHSRPPG
jgi:hypothetical protein